MKTTIAILMCLFLLAMVSVGSGVNVRQSVGSVVDTTEIVDAQFNAYVTNRAAAGSGDMTKAVYDAGDNGVVDSTDAIPDSLVGKSLDIDRIATVRTLKADTGFIGTNAAAQNIFLYFDVNGTDEALYWENASSDFRLSDGLVIDNALKVSGEAYHVTNSTDSLYLSQYAIYKKIDTTTAKINTAALADEATALAANGANASAGQAILGVDASGAAEGAFDVWTEAENTSAGYISANQTITLSGDVTGSGTTSITTTVADNSVDGTHIALGSDASGDVMYYDGTNWVRLAKGSDDQVLKLASGLPSWAADATGGGDSDSSFEMSEVYDADSVAQGTLTQIHPGYMMFKRGVDSLWIDAQAGIHSTAANTVANYDTVKATVFYNDKSGAYDADSVLLNNRRVRLAINDSLQANWDTFIAGAATGRTAVWANALTEDADSTDADSLYILGENLVYGGDSVTLGTGTGIIITDTTYALEYRKGTQAGTAADSFLTSRAWQNITFQPLEATLTDIADGTIVENLVNTANPWADNEVADNITVEDAGIASTIARDAEVIAEIKDGAELKAKIDTSASLYNRIDTTTAKIPTATLADSTVGGAARATNAAEADTTDGGATRATTCKTADSTVAVPDSIAGLSLKIDRRVKTQGIKADTTDGTYYVNVHDFGGATSIEIPNVDNPTTDAEGEIAWDANDDAIEVYSGDESESALIPMYQKIDATIFAPDGVNDQIAIFHVDALLYPFGIEIDQVSITIPADAAYSMVFEEWAGDPPAAQADIETVTTGAGDSYMEDGTITNDQVDADDYIFLDIPATDVDWIHVQVIYHVIQGD